MAVINTSFQQESRDRYLTYALSVVTGRALPDVRDGLKPVQRRILYAMLQDLNLKPTGSHRKSATVVGAVLGKYHPHGDLACYEAMVRMAQDFSLRYPLVDGQGNFGSLDGDAAAAHRYTEVKLKEIALAVLGEIDQETVDFRDNYDASTLEPIVLPSKIPNMLVNGASGIAVGMATSIPPHNLTEVATALIAQLDEPDINISKLLSIIKGPDFPTGCDILNSKKELLEIYETGRGTVRMRGEWKKEDQGRGKEAIIITSIPYALNKSQLVERIANLIIDKKVPQLVDIRDESTDQVRIVLELASGADAEVAMAYLYKNSQLESPFPVNLTMLIPLKDGKCRPERLGLKDILQQFLTFRSQVVERRLRFELKNLLARVHILEGLALIFDALDEAIKIVRKSEGRSDAAEKLRKRFGLTEIQSFAVVDMRIYQLSKTNIDEIRDELKAKLKRVAEIEKILKSKKEIEKQVRSDLEELIASFGDKRRCKIIRDHVAVELNEADYVVQEDIYAIITADGWIKRIRQNNELQTTRLREGDRILRAHPVNTLDSVIFFTNLGSLYVLKASDFPASSGYGNPIQKHLKFKDGEEIIETYAVMANANAERSAAYAYFVKNGDTIVLVSKQGVGFGLTLEGLDQVKRSGKRAIKLRKDDSLAAAAVMNGSVALFTKKACGLVIKSKEVPVRDQPAVGVSLMSVRSDDQLVSAVTFANKATLKVWLDTGKDKEIPSSELTAGRRGLKGTKVVPRGEIKLVEKA